MTRAEQDVGGLKEWIQINRAEVAECEKDLELFQASLQFVKAAPTR